MYQTLSLKELNKKLPHEVMLRLNKEKEFSSFKENFGFWLTEMDGVTVYHFESNSHIYVLVYTKTEEGYTITLDSMSKWAIRCFIEESPRFREDAERILHFMKRNMKGHSIESEN